jgi:hypothetical protein
MFGKREFILIAVSLKRPGTYSKFCAFQWPVSKLFEKL